MRIKAVLVGVATMVVIGYLPNPTDAASQLPLGTFDCGVPVTKSFRLQADKTCDNSDGLVIGKAGIVIDLNGKTVRGGDDFDTAAIENTAFNDVRVRNGVVRDFYYGVRLQSVKRNTVSRIVAVSNNSGFNFNFGAHNSLRGSTSTANIGPGMVVSGTGHVIRGSRFTDNAHQGIQTSTGSTEYLIVANTFSGNALAGIVLRGTRHRVEANRVTSNGHGNTAEPGIHLLAEATQTLVRNNTLVGNGDDGYRDEGTSNKAVENLAQGNGFYQGVSDGFGTGIDASAATTPRGFGNRSSGNDASDQCVPDALCA